MAAGEAAFVETSGNVVEDDAPADALTGG